MCALGENMYFGTQVSLSLGGVQSLENAAFFK